MLDIAKEKRFIILTNILSALQGLFYIWYGLKEFFYLPIFLMAGFDFLYIPVSIFCKRRGLFHYLICYSFIILICTSFYKTELFNNFSALLCLFIAAMLCPKYKNHLIIGYGIMVPVMLVLNDEPLYFFIIHIARAGWIYCVNEFVLSAQYNRQTIILTEDEKRIVQQLCDCKYQKEIELDNYSESTIRRRIKNAKMRNGVKTLEELKDLYKKSLKNE